MNNTLHLTAIALATMLIITSIAACTPKLSSEEIAAQVKIAMEQAEKDKQTTLTSQGFTPPLEAPAQKTTTKNASAMHKPAMREQASAGIPAKSAGAVCTNCGVVLAVKVTEVEGTGSGAGVVAGGVVGGMVGNQLGQGTGNDLATFAGVIGGAIAGNKIEKQSKKTKRYGITVKMDDGAERTLYQATDPDMIKGQKVRIENDVVMKI